MPGDEVLTAVDHRYRRYLLRSLADRESSLSLADLAFDVAAREHEASVGDVSEDRVEAIRQELHHLHVPKLDELGFVDYDRERRVVTLAEQTDQLFAVLDQFTEE